MKEFRLEGDFLFDAQNIDDAFKKLVEHFQRMERGEDSDLIKLGEIHIKPTEGGKDKKG